MDRLITMRHHSTGVEADGALLQNYADATAFLTCGSYNGQCGSARSLRL
jgi:hypothetical protein